MQQQLRRHRRSAQAVAADLMASSPFFLIAGPCAIEGTQHCVDVCGALQEMTAKLGLALVFKSSFDKANRQSHASSRGVGIEAGLRALETTKHHFPHVFTTTDVHESHQCSRIADVVDIIQIPALLCRQTDLIFAATRTGKLVNIKKGAHCAPSVALDAANKVACALETHNCSNSNEDMRENDDVPVLLTDRGTAFGYHDTVVDFRNISELGKSRDGASFMPIPIQDCTHAVQQPSFAQTGSGSSSITSGGGLKYVPTIARAAAAVGAKGLFFETHEAPMTAPCDSANMIPIDDLKALLPELVDIANASRA